MVEKKGLRIKTCKKKDYQLRQKSWEFPMALIPCKTRYSAIIIFLLKNDRFIQKEC